MTEVYTERTTCRLCGSPQLQSVARLPDSPQGDDFVSAEHLDKVQPVCPVELMLCKCGQVQLRHIFNPDLIYKEYTYVTANSLGLVEHFKQYAADTLKRVELHGNPLIVEIGSNAGDMLRAFYEPGVRVLGIDPAVEIARLANKNGIPTINSYFTFELACQIRDQFGSASIITANNVLANIDDLADVVEGVRHLLADDGIFVLETSYLMDVLKCTLVDTCFLEHLSYFSVTPLVYFFRDHGLEMFDVEHVDTKGGSIRCYVKLKSNDTPIYQNVFNFMMDEHFGKKQGKGWYDWNIRLIETRQKLEIMLGEMKQAGQHIGAYGASDGCTEMIYAFGLAPYIDVIFDDNPGKIGKYSPGHHIPVYSSAQIDAVDAVVILAWRYTPAILERNKGYTGKWVQVMPSVEVLNVTAFE